MNSFEMNSLEMNFLEMEFHEMNSFEINSPEMKSEEITSLEMSSEKKKLCGDESLEMSFGDKLYQDLLHEVDKRGRPHMTSDFFKGFLTYLPTHVRFCRALVNVGAAAPTDLCNGAFAPTLFIKNLISLLIKLTREIKNLHPQILKS